MGKTLTSNILDSIVKNRNTRLLRHVLASGEKPMTQNELAVASGLDRATIQRWERQGIPAPSNGHHVGPLPRSLEKFEDFVKSKMRVMRSRLAKMSPEQLRVLGQYL